MQKIALGKSGLLVSRLCLGTMTMGNRTPMADAHAQLDMALDHGCTFLDTAEMYPVAPILPETVGRSEEILGAYFQQRQTRDRFIVATKVTGVGQMAVREGRAMDPAIMRAACEASLKRLKTDVIDLYQLHWPNRNVYHFRENWAYRPNGALQGATVDHMQAMLEQGARLIAEGKVRHLALSNETVWGAAKWRTLAEKMNLPLMVSVQNEYSLLWRQFDMDWAEFSVMEDMPLLAFSPLATGLLTGKYQGGAVPNPSRRVTQPLLGGRISPRVFAAVDAYHDVARAHGLDPIQMAIAFCLTRPFVCIPIIGASSIDQLPKLLQAADLTLSPEVLLAIDAVHRHHPMPY